MAKQSILINRAPVLTLWATVVAEQLGYDRNTALTLGKAVAGLNAQSKGQRLGIFEKPKDKPLKIRRKGKQNHATVLLMGRIIPVVKSADGSRAILKEDIVEPAGVQKYLEQKFGENLNSVQDAMRMLAKKFRPERLAEDAFHLYEKFRPNVPAGEKGWGAKGEVDLKLIQSLAP